MLFKFERCPPVDPKAKLTFCCLLERSSVGPNRSRLLDREEPREYTQSFHYCIMYVSIESSNQFVLFDVTCLK